MNDLRSALQSARRLHRTGGGTVLDILLRSGGASPEALAQGLQQQAGVTAVFSPEGLQADFAVIDQPRAQQMGCVPFRMAGDSQLRVGLADPWDEDRVRKISQALGMVPQLAALTSSALNPWVPGAAGPQQASAGITASAAAADQGVSGPVVDFVDTAIRTGFTQGASDIHFECGRVGVEVKLRQDGVLVPYARLDDVQRAEEVISRIKVLAQLDITERRMPQDGRFRFGLAEGSVDLRVSIMPSVFGEDAVLRLLDKAQLRSKTDAAVSLNLLGFDEVSAERIRELAELPHGMLLVTGPTGSGKTTTVYATLSEINTGLEKIITIEDPVEYELHGVLQIPVNERKGLTFAKGLRSILRHDPDRILVGEIRDAETAEIAVQSALTGHQVFTTVHANSIFDVTGRFRHFGLDMFGFMASLTGVIVQRLVRRLCVHCRSMREPTAKETKWLDSLRVQGHVLEGHQVGHAGGCKACNGTGYKGRSVIAEVHAIDDAFRDMVTGNEPVSVLREHVHRSGVVALGALAAHMVLAGETSAEEIKRVVGWL
ncbi:MAG TPA: ATPase, T2SS/T4P/T4SS family [Burkholderiaceae bacterium]|jgi:general secretion pathway protein E